MLKYRDFIGEFARLQQERENAFQEFYNDVHSGAFPEKKNVVEINEKELDTCLLYTSPSPRDMRRSRMPSSA